MPGFIKVIAWSLAGAIIGGALVFLAFSPTSTDNSVRGFETGQQLLMGIGGAVVGLVLGAIVGVIREHWRRK